MGTMHAAEPAAEDDGGSVSPSASPTSCKAAKDTNDAPPNKLHRPCAQCRTSRVLCDRGLPCGRCVRMGVESTCCAPPTVKRGRPKKSKQQIPLPPCRKHRKPADISERQTSEEDDDEELSAASTTTCASLPAGSGALGMHVEEDELSFEGASLGNLAWGLGGSTTTTAFLSPLLWWGLDGDSLGPRIDSLRTTPAETNLGENASMGQRDLRETGFSSHLAMPSFVARPDRDTTTAHTTLQDANEALYEMCEAALTSLPDGQRSPILCQMAEQVRRCRSLAQSVEFQSFAGQDAEEPMHPF